MKYVLIIVLTLIILRIDMFVGVVERAWKKIPQIKKQESVENLDIPAVSTFAVSDFKENHIEQFQLLLTEFSYNPDRATRELISNYLKKNPNIHDMNSDILFRGLDEWQSIVRGENQEVYFLLNDFIEYFKGKNFQVLLQFYSLVLDGNPEFFFHYYPIHKDPNCIVARYAWNQVNAIEEEVINSRKIKIEELANKIDPTKLDFSKNCLLVIRVESAKTPQPPEDL